MKPKYKRLRYFVIFIILISFALWLILKNFNENIIFFFSPSDLSTKNVQEQIIRVGGLVREGSIQRKDQILEFTITDNNKELRIRFNGIPPNLFRENQGIIAKGKLVNNIFIADELLAKHDENYIPKEVANSLKKSNLWRE
jgi:cytochrome c-type biogenesis protein CcmE